MRYIDTAELLAKRASWGTSSDLWKSRALKKDFREFFFGKCWYTETDLTGSDVHIDHFRPKGRIDPYQHFTYNVPLKDTGYHWLRNDPKNYRACCAFANRKTGAGGKGCYFPLRKGSPLLTENGTEDEKPLLLDPCNQDDVRIISFFGRDIVCISEQPEDVERVDATKSIYNLIDPFITDRRSRVWEDVSKTIAEYSANEITLAVCIRRLSDAVSPRAPYSACAIACVNSLASDEIKQKLDLVL